MGCRARLACALQHPCRTHPLSCLGLRNPDFAEMEQYRSYIASLPAVDSPEVFGLNPIADVAVLLQEGSGLLSSLCSTQAEVRPSRPFLCVWL